MFTETVRASELGASSSCATRSIHFLACAKAASWFTCEHLSPLTPQVNSPFLPVREHVTEPAACAARKFET